MRLPIVALLGLAAVFGSGCAAEKSSAAVEGEEDDYTSTRTIGTLELGIDGAPDFKLVATATVNPSKFLLNGTTKCLLTSSKPFAKTPEIADNAPKQQHLLCGLGVSDTTVVIAKDAIGYVARLAGRISDSKPICPWGYPIAESAKSKVCFPAGTYEFETDSPEIRLTQRSATGDHPFVVADRVDEALNGLVGSASIRGATITGVAGWSLFELSNGSIQPIFTLADGSTTRACESSSWPRVYGMSPRFESTGLRPAVDVTNDWKTYLASPSPPFPTCQF